MPENRHKTGFRGPDPQVGEATQFKPGQSGNPGGRSRKLTRILEEMLAMPVPNDKLKRTYAQKFIEETLKRAIRKSDSLAKEIFDRIDGKSLQALQFEGRLESLSLLSDSELNNRIIALLAKSPELLDLAESRVKEGCDTSAETDEE